MYIYGLEVKGIGQLSVHCLLTKKRNVFAVKSLGIQTPEVSWLFTMGILLELISIDLPSQLIVEVKRNAHNSSNFTVSVVSLSIPKWSTSEERVSSYQGYTVSQSVPLLYLTNCSLKEHHQLLLHLHFTLHL